MPAQGNPIPPLKGGTTAVDTIMEGYVFESGIHKPEMSNILSFKYPQYLLTSLLDRLGASEGRAQSVYTWDTMDRTREAGSVTNMGATGTATTTFTAPEFAYSTAKPGYLIVKDVIRLDTGVLARVTASADDGGLQAVTVEKVDGSVWAVEDIADGSIFGHAFNSFGEGTGQPEGRLYLPVEDYNRMTILKRTIKITGSEITNKTWLGNGEAWYWTQEDIEMDEFARDRENTIMFGELSDAPGSYTSRGLLDWALNEGIDSTYASGTGVTEGDLIAHIKTMLIEGTSNQIIGLCGASYLADIQVALRDYAVAGALNYGTFGDNMAGLDFQSYKFLGKTLSFAHYVPFDDEKVVPYAGAGSDEQINFSEFALFLDLGTDSGGKKLITMVHKEHDGSSRKFIHAVKPGMMSPSGANGGIVSNDFDGFEIYYLSEIGLEVRLPNRLGVMRSA